ncbi:replication-associated recombination protein A [Tepidibacillus infernus]|uniref:replication-associated recombination protein A n=1 Tax=Tepidibacillus TaxID=1494427 RepID=UPI00085332C2|nr:replication-associated recombination protein A [Tepidibacillus sp. HK-1]GBF10071.1 replication-associated recombination protein A [Tepidibacillus sp. HK-1]
MYDLFSSTTNQFSPLADRLRPRNLDEYIGQKHIVGKGKLLRRAIEADRISSIILYGPPGTGKTSLAYVISQVTQSEFVRLNAVSAGVKEVREVIEKASEQVRLYGRKTILFLDEIHRFNKAQQDALLPSVEKGDLILIGATTENPFFEVNSALLSRSQLFRLEPLIEDEMKEALEMALTDKERGLGNEPVEMEDEALQHIIYTANGDLRKALNALELAVTTTPPDADGKIRVTLAIAEESIQQPAIRYDTGDARYDMMSAMIKSIRGSATDAALYWMARMLEAGEDPKLIVRRLIVHASEDIGMANPNALEQAIATLHALQAVGLPEARINIAQCVIYLSESPKSNSVIQAIDSALSDVRKGMLGQVPSHLRDAHYKGAKQLGHGIGYKYPHNYPNHFVEQQYLPNGMSETQYYFPSDQGMEAKLQQRKRK